MQDLIASIASKKPVVVWNPFIANDALTKDEFLLLIKLSGYSTVIQDYDWIIAYQPEVKIAHEPLEKQINDARQMGLDVYAEMLQEELIILNSKSIS